MWQLMASPAPDAGADLVGLGWRAPLAAKIFSNADAIDVVEVVAEDFMDGSAAKIGALATLRAHIPIVVHGLSLGLASASAVDERRLGRLARVVEAARPLFWSEHLAFVRAGGIELGHLAAPPRTPDTVAGAVSNLERARQVVGARPLVENIATLVAPPGPLDESTWINGILTGSDADLLLDLHNLYANAVNFGHDPREILARLPAARIRSIHVAGGTWIPGPRGGQPRRLDDHLHAVPDVVYDLLADVAALVPHPLTVILERDGAYPAFEDLLAELARVRAALAAGRARRKAGA
jgi:uncharacterized protein (UPF0276 family)